MCTLMPGCPAGLLLFRPISFQGLTPKGKIGNFWRPSLLSQSTLSALGIFADWNMNPTTLKEAGTLELFGGGCFIVSPSECTCFVQGHGSTIYFSLMHPALRLLCQGAGAIPTTFETHLAIKFDFKGSPTTLRKRVQVRPMQFPLEVPSGPVLERGRWEEWQSDFADDADIDQIYAKWMDTCELELCDRFLVPSASVHNYCGRPAPPSFKIVPIVNAKCPEDCYTNRPLTRISLLVASRVLCVSALLVENFES